MHPETMQAVAAQRGDDLQADAAAARRAREARRSQSAQHAQTTHRAWPTPQAPTQQARPALPVRHLRAAPSGLKQAAATKPFRDPQTAA
jgi:hypothetical protein